MSTLNFLNFSFARNRIMAVFIAVGLVISCAFLSLTSAAMSQGLSDKFGGFSSTSNAPIDIEADVLRVDDIKKIAIFSGNVKAVQGNFEIRSKVLEVIYSNSGTGTGAASASGKVKRLVARGKVLISTKDQQSATSDWANFDVASQKIMLGDQVVLTQGGNVIKGGRLMINLKTRQSRFMNSKKRGRVQMKVDVTPKKKKK